MIPFSNLLAGVAVAVAVIAVWQWSTRDTSLEQLPHAARDVAGETYGADQRRALVAECTKPWWSASDRCGAWRSATDDETRAFRQQEEARRAR